MEVRNYLNKKETTFLGWPKEGMPEA